jgi:hypothetical protein
MRPLNVMPGLVPGIHALLPRAKTWMAGTSPAMTAERTGCYFRFARTPMRSSRGSTSSQKNGSSLR